MADQVEEAHCRSLVGTGETEEEAEQSAKDMEDAARLEGMDWSRLHNWEETTPEEEQYRAFQYAHAQLGTYTLAS